MFRFTTARQMANFSESDSDSDCEGDVDQHRFVKNYGLVFNALEDEQKNVERLMDWNQRLFFENQELNANGTSVKNMLRTNQETVLRSQKQQKWLIEKLSVMQNQLSQLQERNQALSSKNISLINELIEVEEKAENKVEEIRAVLKEVHSDLIEGKVSSQVVADKIQRFAVRKAIEENGYYDSEMEN